MKIHFAPEATREVEEAKRWYRERDAELGLAFEDAILDAVQKIRTHADRWPLYIHGMQRFRLRRFPYALVYLQESKETIWVVAIAHQRRRPGYWEHRIPRTL